MRYHQLVLESAYTEDLKDEILNLLTIASARGIKNLRTSFLVKDLKNLGFEVDVDTIVTAMNGIDMVASADKDKIQISSPTDNKSANDDVEVPQYDDSPFGGFDEEDPDAETSVDKAAAKQAIKDIKL